MKKGKREKQAGAYHSAIAWCASTLPSAVTTGLVAIILGIALIYSLHPYLAILGLILLSSILVKVSDRASDGSLQKTAAATAAVAVFLIMFAVPSGELGASKCPERIISGTVAVTVKYFESPFCASCVIFANNIVDAQKQAGFTLEYYDSRYCKAEMARYGFPGTPCYAFVPKSGQISKACGLMTADEIVQKVSRIS